MKTQFSTALPSTALKGRFHFFTWMPLLLLVLIYTSCKKPDLKSDKEQLEMQAMSGEAPLSINMSEFYAKLPLTILHNSGNRLKLEEEHTEWLYKGDSLVARVKVSGTENTYLFAVKTLRNPEETNVYIVQLNRSSGSSEESFTGTQEWIDLQTWNIYGLEFDNGVAVKNRKVESTVGGHWERCMLEQGYFYMEPDSTIAARESVTGLSGAAVTMDDGCPRADGAGKSMWTRIGEIFNSVANYIATSTPYEYGPGGGGGGWSWPINWSGGGGPAGGGSGGGPIHGIGTPANSDVALLKGALNLNDLEVIWLNHHLNDADEMEYFLMQDYINCTCGLSQPQRKGIIRDHLTMMMENPDYVTKISNLTGNWWDRDQNGMVEARKIHMELYLQANPYGMIDCNDINQLPMQMYQDVGSYQVPQSVLTRLSVIRNENAPLYNNNSFRVKNINEATGGVVNCDYFYVPIYSLPYLNGTQMTADQLLEYFRLHLNDFIAPNVDVSFQPYIDVVGNVNINETSKWNMGYENSLGALVHIDMAQDGTVVESGYTRNTGTQNHSFTFTTMYAPLDGNHPVAGNRRFGIFKSGSTYYLYFLGVDRTNDYVTTILNLVTNVAFNGADDLWRSIQSGILDFCDTHQGNASVSAEEKIARPKWNKVKDFLLGKIKLQQYKADLNCP